MPYNGIYESEIIMIYGGIHEEWIEGRRNKTHEEIEDLQESVDMVQFVKKVLTWTR